MYIINVSTHTKINFDLELARYLICIPIPIPTAQTGPPSITPQVIPPIPPQVILLSPRK